MTPRRRPKRASATRRESVRRPGSLRRRAILIAALAALVSGMLVSIRRGAEGRRLSELLEELEREERAARARLADVMVRVDSLGSRERILEAGRELGLRPAMDGEIIFLSEPGSGEGETP
ncbi:MAG: hypothetical protein ACE5JR_00220 [Gemmatimonadota bacterium]